MNVMEVSFNSASDLRSMTMAPATRHSPISLSFVRELSRSMSRCEPDHRSVRNDTLLEAIVALGNKLNMTMIAEGIETDAQLDRLRQLGCELGQGFLFSPAVPAASALAMLSRTPWK